MIMKKWLGLTCLCAALALAGCGAKTDAPTKSEAAAQPAPAVIEMQPAASQAPEAAPKAPETAVAAEAVFTAVDSSAQFFDDGTRVTVTGGAGKLTIGKGAWTRDVEIGEGASLHLTLQPSAMFTGVIHGTSMQDVSISLDALSVWTLTGDVAVGAIVNADASFSNVRSDGYSIEYNSESEDNAYLAGAAKQLPGGGFLTPLI